MKQYDPLVAPDASDWLKTPEAERFDLVTTYHRRHGIRLPNQRLHAAIHVIVENQIALGEQIVVDVLGRLQHEGLDRHDAIHAVGMVLSEHIVDVLKTEGAPTPELHAPYFERLKRLSAEEWRRSR